MATPIVEPTWRSAVSRADPAPLRSADSAPRATPIEAGRTRPTPRPARATQARVYPVELPSVVNAPTAIAPAISRYPPVSIDRGPAAGGRAPAPAPPARPPAP